MTPLTRADTLVRPKWARLKFCNVRGRWVLLVPERVLYPCPTTVEVLGTLAEPARFGDIVDSLAGEYDAPAETIEADLAPVVSELIEDGYVRRIDA